MKSTIHGIIFESIISFFLMCAKYPWSVLPQGMHDPPLLSHIWSCTFIAIVQRVIYVVSKWMLCNFQQFKWFFGAILLTTVVATINLRLYIDVGRIVGPGRMWRSPSHCLLAYPIFWFFYFLPPTYFLKYFFIQNQSLRPWFSLHHKTQNPTNPQPSTLP
jgi:hypothetical protein